MIPAGTPMDFALLGPNAAVLAAAVALDLVLGDPVYPAHPIRLMGRSATFLEACLRAMDLDGYAGGVLLGLSMVVLWCGATGAALIGIHAWSDATAFVLQVYLVYSLLALRNLLDHAWAVEKAARDGDLPGARHAISMLVGRDTDHLGFAECRRAAIESVSENLTDGYVSALFWYAVGGLPGLLAFKVFSTLDSMVGNRSERYVRFGWFSARMDDVLNWLPARLTWLLVALTALFVPRCSARKALALGWRQHGVLPSPNSGWSEAATAGALGRRLVGPIRMGGLLVTELWLGDPADPPAGEDESDLRRAAVLCTATGLLTAVLCIGALRWGLGSELPHARSSQVPEAWLLPGSGMNSPASPLLDSMARCASA